jgi:hypothetical protein
MGCEEGLEFSVSGMAGAQPGRETTMAAQADPRSTASRMSRPSDSEASSPAMKLSPAPVGLSASTG